MGRPRTTNKHLPKYVTVIHGSFWYGPPNTKRVRIGPEDDLAGMYKFMAARLEPTGPITTMLDLFDKYEREIVPRLAATTQKDYRWIIGKLRPTFGHMLPHEITTKDVGKLFQVEKGKQVRVRMVAVLSAIFGYAIGEWFIDGLKVNPCRELKRPRGRKRKRYITHDEFWAIHALMPLRHQIMMELALTTAQRQGDLLTLKWSAVLKEGVYFEQGKTGKRLLVPFIKPTPENQNPTDPLREALLRAKMLVPHFPREYVIRTAKGRRYSNAGFRAIWGRVMRKAMKDGVLKERYTFHDIRAKSISDTKSLQDAFERAGHTSMAMTRGVYDRGVREVSQGTLPPKPKNSQQ